MISADSLVEAVASLSSVAPSVADVAGVLKVSVAETGDALVAACESGRLEAWERGGGLCLVLTPLEASRRGLLLDGLSKRWRTRPDRRPFRLRSNPRIDPRADLSALPDDGLVTVVLFGCAPWPRAGQSREPFGPKLPEAGCAVPFPRPCEACGGRRARGLYCAVCDRPRGSEAVACDRGARRRAARRGDLKGGVG